MSIIINVHKTYYILFAPENHSLVKNELSEQKCEIDSQYDGIIIVRADKPPILKFGTVEIPQMHALHCDCY